MQSIDDVETWLDTGHFGHFINLHYEAAVFARMKKLGFIDVRGVHGYVVQCLIDGPQSMSAMARTLDVSQQAVSKWVAELMQLGLVAPVALGRDARERPVQLTPRGRHCLRVSREARAAVTKKLEAKLGKKALASLNERLAEALNALGGLVAVHQRRVQVPPSQFRRR